MGNPAAVTNVIKNPFYAPSRPAAADPAVLAFHRSMPGYAATPLVELPELAAELNVAAIWVKDESQRFGLRAFKALGASYAIHKFLQSHPGQHTLACASDGNHGRAVAWSAAREGQSAVVYLPRNAPAARAAAIREQGARVEIIDGTYDEAVARVAADAQANGWQVISDTAYDGYTEIPLWIMAGYRTIFVEIDEQLKARRDMPRPDFVFVQTGVGGLAYAAVQHYGNRATLVSVEPVAADCCRVSILSPRGGRAYSSGAQDSVMDCLNCGIPSLVAWPALREGIRFFLAVEDGVARRAQGLLGAHMDSGATGAAGLAGLLAASGSCRNAKVLLINTEGNVIEDNQWKR